jgi:hypothetical protein
MNKRHLLGIVLVASKVKKILNGLMLLASQHKLGCYRNLEISQKGKNKIFYFYQLILKAVKRTINIQN